jgi:glycosyltransferase involved in cell wall biosynthesis
MARKGRGRARPAHGRSTIALIHYAAPPVVGGVEQVLAHQASLMADAGHVVRIVAGRGAPTDDRVAFTTIPLMDPRDPTIVRIQAVLDAGRVPEDFSAVSDALAEQIGAALSGVDVVVAHNVCSLHLNLPLTAALRSIAGRPGAPRFILWHHDLAWTSPTYRPRLHDGFPWDLLRAPWPGASHVVISEARRAELASLGVVREADITVIPNGIDLARSWKLEPETRTLLADAELAAAAPLLLMPARILPRKNIELGVRVVAEMRRAGRRAGLIVTGPVDPHQPAERDYMDGLHELRRALGLDDSAWFLSEELAVPPTDAVMADLFRLADFLFMPSRDEGFGLPILEAAAARLPIVCSDLPSLRELAGDAALYVGPDDDPAEIATRILARFDADPVGQLAREVRAKYAWEAVFRERIEPLLARD